jgi:ABC-type bacteriocin/lantibiotic exporter with double-glycine peptidase domain
MSLSTFVLSFVFAFLRGWQLALMMCAALPVLAVTGAMMGSVIGKMTEKGLQAYSAAGAVAEESLGNMRTVAAFGSEAKCEDKYELQLNKSRTMGLKSAQFGGATVRV